ncbi:unnamed protein product [Zymoseptoria tritici ST99CH_3D1]|nr:unnamed protein product [Zymoseptoria tritici ST99CH_3D1]
MQSGKGWELVSQLKDPVKRSSNPAPLYLTSPTRRLSILYLASMAVEHVSLPNGTDYGHRGHERGAYTYASNNATSQQPSPTTPANSSVPSQFEIPKDEVGYSSDTTPRRARVSRNSTTSTTSARNSCWAKRRTSRRMKWATS